VSRNATAHFPGTEPKILETQTQAASNSCTQQNFITDWLKQK